MITGALPPSSRWTRFRFVSAAALRIYAAGRDVAGQRGHADLGVADEADADRVAVTGDDVEDALGEEVAGQFGEPDRRQRGVLGGLQDQRVAGHQRRADLPDRHQQRVVPGATEPTTPSGSRRIMLVWPGMYSPVARPRARGRHRRRSAGGRRSSRPPRAPGPSACRHSVPPARRTPLRRPRGARASFSRALARSPGVVSDQAGKAASAAATAASTSAAEPAGTSAICSPVAGAMTATVFPSIAGRLSPSMNI